MGLGRLEFGYPFQLHPPGGTKHPLKKEPPTKPPAVHVPGRVLPTVSSHGIVPQPLPPRSQVVLITDASQDPTSIDQRGLPSGSSVVLVIDQQYDVHFHDPRSAGKSPETVGSPSKTKRRNPLRDTVRLRWSVFHPEYTEKSEFVFQPSQQQSSRPEPKRKLSVTLIEQKSKRTRDDDVEGPVFNEKPAAIVEDPIAESASQSAVGPVAVVVEDPISADLDTEPIQQLATPPPELELVPEIEVEETEVANVEIIQQQPSPPPSPATTPIPLKFDAEEEAAIKEAIKEAMGVGEPSQSEVETELEAEADSDVDAFAIDLSTLPPLPESEPASPAIEPVQVEDDNDMDDEINLATLPALPDPDSPLVEPTEVEEQGDAVLTSLQLDDMPEDDKPQADAIPPRQMIQQPSPPPSEPGTPVMDTKKDDAMKVVPWMPLTPPETPLSMRHGRERVIEFNMTIPLYMQPPSTPSSILDSPVFFRGKDRQLEDGPTHYFIPAPPSPSSPSHSILDSPLASRMRRIGETIKEEEEEGEEEEVEVEAKAEELPAVVVIEEEDENDVEEIVRSPQLSYPSPPSSPMPSVIDSPVSKGKELSRVPSFTIIYSPSPPPSIRDVLMYDEDKSIAPSPAPEAPVSSKGKEREVLLEKTLPSPVLEQEEFEQDEEEGLNHRSTIYPSGWATADDIFTNPDHQYTYQYNSRPPTPASSIGSLSRRWSGISRMSYNTAITTPPATRPGSAIGGTPTGNHKLISWSDNDHLLRRTDSFASSIRRELFRDQSTSRTRKPLLVSADTSTEKKRPALRWSVSMPLIREQWTIRYPLVVSPAEKGFVGLNDEDVEEYDVHIPGSIQLLPLTRGVIVTPPRIERRRRVRTTSSAGPHRRKVRSLVVYSPDEQLEGIGQLFGDLHELSDVEDEIAAAERIVEIVETVGAEQNVPREVVTETVKEQEEVVEVLKEKKKSVLKRLKTRASALKEKVKVKVHSSKKGKEKANGATIAV
ncbi:hypothetical protein BDD12DRAFT_822963 [Trichophaea hybrida]|nr:hypothetical protein BDD12DRAFT_822963 [Trichophaea hybrida]